jgi:hypothetical protein
MKPEKHQNARTLTTIGIVNIGVSASTGKTMEADSLVPADMLKASSELASVSSSIVLAANSKKLSKQIDWNIDRPVIALTDEVVNF